MEIDIKNDIIQDRYGIAKKKKKLKLNEQSGLKFIYAHNL